MNAEEKEYFDALTRDRAESATVHEKPSERGYWKSVVDKYSEQAHFVYELLQNADDCEASRVKFILEKSGLFFIHNGTKHFTVSNPDTEGDATKILGHINSICSIGNSTKTDQSIGKFGLGFKSVFQFTLTPHIYDRDFQFKIERFIVPVEMSETERKIFEHIKKNEDETVFWFPFDHKKTENLDNITDFGERNYFETWDNRQRVASEAYKDILEKLKALNHPVLFLTHLKSISFESSEISGKYSKGIEEEHISNGTAAQLVSLDKITAGESSKERLWIFTGKYKNHSCSAGFFLDDQGKLKSSSFKAFCYFPTRESTGLNFIIHAPFLLTDSREGIKVGEPWNETLVQELAVLAADSLLFLRDKKLIDDDIIDLIPLSDIDVLVRSNESLDNDEISFLPFFYEIKKKFQNESILPASGGEYVSKQNAYWFQDNPVVQLFSDEQLQQLTGNPNARWVFLNLARNQTDNNSAKRRYLEDCVAGYFEMEALLKKLDKPFIERQPEDWLHRLYEYLNENPSRVNAIKRSPIFIDENGNAVPVRDVNDQVVLFLPDDTITGHTTIKSSFLENETTREFIERLGVKKPDLRDEIYAKIIPFYNSPEHRNDKDKGIPSIEQEPYLKHFREFFRYFKECSLDRVDEFINLIRDKAFLLCRSIGQRQGGGSNVICPRKASEIYMPGDDLEVWFAPKPDTVFLCSEKYRELAGPRDSERLDDFLKRLGIRYAPAIESREMLWNERNTRGLRPQGREDKWTQGVIDGCAEIISNVSKDNTLSIWNTLMSIEGLSYKTRITHTWFFYTKQIEYIDGDDKLRLQEEKWILAENGSLVSAGEVTLKTLSGIYETKSERAQSLIRFLGIKEDKDPIDDIDPEIFMTSEQKEQFRLGRIAQESGLSTDELEEAIKRAKEEKLRKKSTDGNDNKPKDHEEGKLSRTMREVNELVNEKMQSRKTVSGDKEPFGGDIAQGTPPAPDEDEDTDEYIKPPINFDRKIKHEQERSASELARIERERELNGAVQTSEKYRSGWFRALLELEGLAQGQEEAAGRSVSISFGKTEPEAGTEKTLLLSHPSRSIPPALEELSNIRLELDLKTAQKSVTVEALSIKGYTVRAKLTSKDALGDIDLSKVAEAKINVQSPAFLQKSLQSCFESLHFQDDKNLQEDLPKNIEFVFGPPGTGKTTYLAKNVLMPLMKAGESARVLVLAPTNKAADVLVRRVMDESGEDKSYEDWLIRFVTTNDEIIEKSKCFRDRTCNLESLKRGVAVTTVARFTYDTFEQESGSKRLHDVHWDYIVVDEASMVHLPHIIFVLYNQKPKKFIIAGDPFQIGPIARVDIWKDENIYTLIQLKSFANPTTVPHKYNVICLNKQYRSIPSVGKIFSGLSYNGILSHNRTEDDRRPLAITGLDTAPLNIIKFPVSGYESIYRAKRLNGSPYQVYSALFTVEFCRYLVSEISKNNRNENWKIGVISPYRIQADIIDKTITRMNVPANIEVNAGTIHGFQGDECDIIIALFNPPQTISDSKEIFLNKRNIINVSISRARDYLFVVMPDDDTENVKNLTVITKVEKLCREQTGCTGYRSHDIEGLIFGSRSYIEDNAFSTSHQSVNVYGKPEKHYEVRSEDKAVDIQIEDPL